MIVVYRSKLRATLKRGFQSALLWLVRQLKLWRLQRARAKLLKALLGMTKQNRGKAPGAGNPG